MNVAIIFAGGTGQRMNTKSRPKQFLELHGKPIIIYTIEQFEQHEKIGGIIVVCVKDWIQYCKDLLAKYKINKVVDIVPGGETGMLSRYNGIMRASEEYSDESICLLHDGVRPLINHEIISNNIICAEKNGSAITVSPAMETIAVKDDNGTVGRILDRKQCQIAKAPQTFRLGDLRKTHQKAIEDGITDCIDTAYLMQIYGFNLFTVEGSSENIKITTPMDFYIFRALIDAKENSQIFGV